MKEEIGTSQEIISPQELEKVNEASEKMLSESMKLHGEFNETKWGGKESFHNEKHIKAVATAADKLVEAAIANKDTDPFGLRRQLDDWNSNKGTNISMEEFRAISRMASADHDFGNVMKDLKEESGELVPDYQDKYLAEGAEHRSMDMFDTHMRHAGIPEDKIKAYSELGQALIEATIPGFKGGPSVDKPFVAYVQSCDQIGNDVFTENKQAVPGLIREMAAENDKTEINPRFFNNFAENQFPNLVKDQAKRNEVYKIWDPTNSRKGYDDSFLDQKILAKDYVVMREWSQRELSGRDTGIDARFKAQFNEKFNHSYDEIFGSRMRGWNEMKPENA